MFNDESFSIVLLHVGSFARQVKCTMICMAQLILLGFCLNTLHKCESNCSFYMLWLPSRKYSETKIALWVEEIKRDSDISLTVP